MAEDGGDGNGEDEVWAKATIDAAESTCGPYFHGGFHWEVCNSDNDRCLEPATTIRLDGGMQDISDVEIFMKVLLWMFLFFSSLHYFTSLDLSPVQMALAWVLTTSWDISSGGGESLCAGSDERLPRAVLIGWGTYGFVPLHTYNSFLIVSFPFHSCTGLCSQGGRHLKRGIM